MEPPSTTMISAGTGCSVFRCANSSGSMLSSLYTGMITAVVAEVAASCEVDAAPSCCALCCAVLCVSTHWRYRRRSRS